jgi:deoxyribodipyrimidine photo-lyase
MSKISLFWFRRDLRLEDNRGLFAALKAGLPVLPIFIFDTIILNKLSDKSDARVSFIYNQVKFLKEKVEKLGGSFYVAYGNPVEIIDKITNELPVKYLFTNKDYESYALQRDQAIKESLETKNIPFHLSKDHVIFEEREILSKSAGTPYTVFTPYSKSWKEKLKSGLLEGENSPLFTYDSEGLLHGNLYANAAVPDFPTLDFMHFQPSKIDIPSKDLNLKIVENYSENRDFPAKVGTSRLGIHLRFGTIGIRELARKIINLNETFLNELIWRDFYAQILFNFPHVEKNAFRSNYDLIKWRNNIDDFNRWTVGKTGFPLVDAGMRELNATGFMHNRVRMLTASFLTKNLLIDWRWGEKYFAEKLLDFDLASNNGGWQWAAGSGTDAAPYFRIFSPEAQMLKFDAQFQYIKKWVPEFGTPHYVKPMIDSKLSKDLCLAAYQLALKSNP